LVERGLSFAAGGLILYSLFYFINLLKGKGSLEGRAMERAGGKGEVNVIINVGQGSGKRREDVERMRKGMNMNKICFSRRSKFQRGLAAGEC
jgi:hypothetical protein